MEKRKRLERAIAAFGASVQMQGCSLGEDDTFVLAYDDELLLHAAFDSAFEQLIFSLYFGPIPQDDHTALLRELLLANSERKRTQDPVACLDARSGAVVLTAASEINADFDGETVHAMISELVRQAEAWRARIAQGSPAGATEPAVDDLIAVVFA